jgi:23S rRNA (cytidine1920-2'-O)/16S rRNA (cytidine1409-2'-O)-methyltransferase
MLARAPDLLVCDASFIALEKLLDVPLGLAAPQAVFVGLFKPQFQVGRTHVGKGGVVTDTEASDRAAEAFGVWMNEKGWPIHAWTASPISGGDGNAERLFYAIRA